MLQITPKTTQLTRSFVVDNFSKSSQTVTYYLCTPLCQKKPNNILWYLRLS